MATQERSSRHGRRAFLQTLGVSTGIGKLIAQSGAGWQNRIGLELYTVRDLLAKDFEGTVAKVAEIGYKEVEPVGYGGLDPKQFRALLDRYGLTAPSTHAGVTAGPDVEKELEGQQIMGIKYTEVHGPARAANARPAARIALDPNTGEILAKTGGAAAGGTGGQGAARKSPPPQSEESVKRTAAQLNEQGRLVKKFGMKILVHNHTQEFEALNGSSLRPYDILLAETDPSLVAMQLDIGWASVSGQNILQMFQKNPGRYELWHVKDATGLKNMDPALTPNARRQASKLVPVGMGDVDYKAIFAKANLAGLKHFCIEQDNAADSGDSMAAARTSYVNLKRMLS